MPPAPYAELSDGEADNGLEAFDLGGSKRLLALERLLRALHRVGDDILVDLVLVDRAVGQNRDLLAGDLGESAADHEELGHAALGRPELARADLGDEGDVAGKDAD